MDYSGFWHSPEAGKVKEPGVVRELLRTSSDDAEFFDLLFHARFANNLMGLLKREGNSVEGFQRMQQSFIESVERIRSILTPRLANSPEYVAVTGSAFARLLELIGDLALVKEWQVRAYPEMTARHP